MITKPMIKPSPQQQLKKLANPKKAIGVARFFKTGKGEYVQLN